MVDSNGVCKLADFGHSKKIESLGVTVNNKTLTGTPFFMAPEVRFYGSQPLVAISIYPYFYIHTLIYIYTNIMYLPTHLHMYITYNRLSTKPATEGLPIFGRLGA